MWRALISNNSLGTCKKNSWFTPAHTSISYHSHMVIAKDLPVRRHPTPAIRQRQKIMEFKVICKTWPNTVPAIMNTWRPRHRHETNSEYRKRVVVAGDGDVYRAFQILTHQNKYKNAIIEQLLAGETGNIRTFTCSVCKQTEYAFREDTRHSAHLCYGCTCVKNDTDEWMNISATE
jgi:hypothetical protein